jgi:hypothetical protein
LANLREIYEKVVIEKVSGEAAMEHKAFASLLMACTLVLSDGYVLFKLLDLTCPASTPEELFIIREGDKYLRIDCLREPPTTLTPSY